MTNLSITDINALAAAAAGTEPTRTATKDKAIAKLTAALAGAFKGDAPKAAAALLACADRAAALEALRGMTARAAAAPASKLQLLTAAARAGDWQGALAIAAKFHDLGDHKAAIVRAHEAYGNPAFYAQIGRDPDAMIAAGIDALIERYRIDAKAPAKRKAAPTPAAKPAPKAAPAPKAPAAPAAAPAGDKAAPKATGKYKAILADAERGITPPAPDFSAKTHAAYRGKLAALVALVEAGDVAGLEAVAHKPYDSSMIALCRYRDFALIALKAQAAARVAA